MKKSLLLSLALSFSLISFAQTQQGYVKTKGRMVDGQLVPGQGLKGATVSIKGKTAVLVNKDDGAFSFPVPETQFRVDSVRKKGYQLVDMDALSKTYKHSANPIYLVMETPEQQLQDQLAAERKIRRTLTDQLHQREDEIEALKEQQKITDEEYRQALQKLYEETDQNEQLVKDMVERYSTIDYDQLSEFDQRISELILNGELTKADSMLRTKGDINQRAENYQRHKAINSKEKEELTRRQASLELSETAAQKELEDLANDCYRKFEIFKMQHLNDSAAYYIELRAGLDTTNAEWTCNAAEFIHHYLSRLDDALDYYNKALQTCLSLSDEYRLNVAALYSNIGQLYSHKGNEEKALVLFEKSVEIYKNIEGESITDSSPYNNMACSYYNLGQTEKALEYFEKALEIDHRVYGEGHINLATTYNNLGVINSNNENFDDALEFFIKAEDIYVKNFGSDNPEMANTYNNIGMLYYGQNDFDNALVYFNKALTIQESVLGTFHYSIATSYHNIAATYGNLGDFSKCMEYNVKSLNIKTAIFGENSLEVAYDYNNLGVMMQQQKEYEKALEYHNKAYKIRKTNLGNDNINTLYSYYNIASVYKDLGRNEEALSMFNYCLDAFIAQYGEIHSSVASAYIGIGNVYKNLGNYELLLLNYNKALEIRKTIFGEDNQITIQTQQKISEVQAKLKEQENEQKIEE